MKKNIIVLIGIMLVAVISIAPVVGNILNKEKEEEISAGEKLNSVYEQIEDIEKSTVNSDEEEQKYKKLVEDVAELEKDCEVYSYKEEIEIRVNTIETAISDMERDIKRGVVPTKLEKDCKNRIEKLTPVAKKYRKILDNDKKEKLNYEEIAKELDEELNKVYEEINN